MNDLTPAEAAAVAVVVRAQMEGRVVEPLLLPAGLGEALLKLLRAARGQQATVDEGRACDGVLDGLAGNGRRAAPTRRLDQES